MKIEEIDNETIPTDNAETLWENFEKTGSVKAYLLYVQKLGKTREILSDCIPS